MSSEKVLNYMNGDWVQVETDRYQNVINPASNEFIFSGQKDSFFGALHGRAEHTIEFCTQTKVVVERWPKKWSR